VRRFNGTQQQAMFIAWFFLPLSLFLMSGCSPIESMPNWAQQITLFNPIRYFVEIIRMVMLWGYFSDISTPFFIFLLCVVINGLAV
jgi:ABC-2 type transport system permease protein